MTDDKPILKEGIFPGLESFAKSWEESREKAKEEAKATTRNIPFDQPDKEGTCIVCGKPSKRKVYFARAY